MAVGDSTFAAGSKIKIESRLGVIEAIARCAMESQRGAERLVRKRITENARRKCSDGYLAAGQTA